MKKLLLKIEQEMIDALKNNRNMCKDNTAVICLPNCKYVKLYDSIIYVENSDGKFYSNGGWDTKTTNSRLKALGFDKKTMTLTDNIKIMELASKGYTK